MHSLVKYWLIAAGIIISVIGLISGCGTGPDTFTSGKWKQAGLPESEVNMFQVNETMVFAGATTGLFKKELSNNSDWSYIGLDTDSTEVVDIITWDSQEMMVAIQYEEYNSTNKVIHKTDDGGKSWVSYGKYFEGENIDNFLRRLVLVPDSPNKIYALGGLPIARSTDRGKSWEAVFETWKLGAFGEFLKIDPQDSNIIWSGGQTNLFDPHLVKSTDAGDTWQRLPINGSNSVYDLTISRNSSDHVLAGTGIGILKSIDGGQNWQPVFEEAFISTFTHSARNPEVVYASGENADGTLFFAASRDFGDSWEMIEWEDSPAGVEVNDMATVMAGGAEILYLGTNNGIFTYRFEE